MYEIKTFLDGTIFFFSINCAVQVKKYSMIFMVTFSEL